jgi:hypothetical protein
VTTREKLRAGRGSEAAAGVIRAAAADLARVANDYATEGLTGLAEGFRVRAVELLAVAADMDRPRSTRRPPQRAPGVTSPADATAVRR